MNEEIYYEEEEMIEDEYDADFVHPPDTPWWIKKSPAVLVSLGVHALILIVTAYVSLMDSADKETPELLVRQPLKRHIYNDKAEKDIKSKLKIPTKIENKKHPVIPLDDVKIVTEKPRGTSWNNMSNKDRRSEYCIDAYGIGPGGCGAYGTRDGTGTDPNPTGGPATECSVRGALRWLKRHQDLDGGWDIDGFTRHCEGPKCGGEAQVGHFDTGASALALLAYLGNGQTHRWGEYRKTVNRGIHNLMKEQDPDGCFGRDPEGRESWFYNHAIGLMAISEAYGMTGDMKLKQSAERALRFGLEAQNPGYGWRYEPRGGDTDTSVTGWMVLALKAAKTAGLDVPQSAFDDARKWFDRVTDSNGRCGYKRRGDSGSILKNRPDNRKFERQETMTAVSMICRIFTGQSKNARQVKQGAELLMKKPPTFDKPENRKVNYYYWYNGTYAMFQIGGEKWKKWNEEMKKALLGSQRTGGCADGSWDSTGEWCIIGGRVYATAINALTMEIYYRYEKMDRQSKVASSK